MAALLTPKQLALAAGVSESTVKRWCDRGLLPVARTPGGHRRIQLHEALRVLKELNLPLRHPEALGLPAFSGQGQRVLEKAKEELLQALITAQADRCRVILHELRCVGLSFAEIADHVIAPAFEQIGQEWECGKLHIYQERVACCILSEVLAEVASTLPEETLHQPLAIGATLSQDHYVLASQLVQLVLREKGWRARFLGPNLPAPTLRQAIADWHPRLFWLSISHVTSRQDIIEDCRDLFTLCRQIDCLFVVGGRSIDESLRRQLRYSAYCPDLTHLAMLLDTLPPLVQTTEGVIGRSTEPPSDTPSG
ncbi:MAG: DNA-binding protein [Thermogutta sp.]|nr:MAG: DNA-binding protein [Thermogutta sp.]